MRRALPVLAASLALGACGSLASVHTNRARAPLPRSTPTSTSAAYRAHPQAVEPVAGASALVSGGGAASVGVSSAGSHSGTLPQPISLDQVKRELAASGLSASSGRGTLTPQLLALAPASAPAQVQELIDAGNEIAHLPYVWGGGHGRFVDTGYDCSGSLSFILAAAGLLDHTETSGELERYGDPGPGRWVTIFANAGHTFAYIAGLRFDTVALAETGSRWSNRSADEPGLSGFVVRHPPGL